MSTFTKNPSDQQQPRQSERALEDLRERLEKYVDYVDDDELKLKLVNWISRSYGLPAPNPETYIETQLSELESENRMHDHDGVDDPEDAFPDACQDCRHYGSACPIVTQQTPRDELDRVSEESETEGEFKRGVRKVARLWDCLLIPKWLSNWETRHVDVIEEGWQLYAEANVDLSDMDAEQARPLIDPTASDEDDNDGGRYR